MAIPWPTTLPAPRADIELLSGDNVVRRTGESGRIEGRRFGWGAFDTSRAVFRLKDTQPAIFEAFWLDSLNMGMNWVTASWLDLLGYDHATYAFRIIGYPARTAHGLIYSDYSVDLTFGLLANAWADTTWGSI